MKSALLVLNGSKPKQLPSADNFDIVCAVDGAYNQLKKLQVIPDLITGDFDSLEALPDSIEIINTPNQDYTDFEKALEVLHEREVSKISIYGGSGNESDHFLGNISVALAWKEKLNIRFYDEFGSYFFIPKTFKITNVASKTISIIPLPVAENMTTKGLLYTLTSETLEFGNRIGTRNRAVSDVIQITYSKGNVLLYISN